MGNLEELQNGYGQLKHEWFMQKSFDRPPTVEQMEGAMKLVEDALNLLEEVLEDDDFEEIRTELKHRICAIINEEVQ